MTKRRDLKKDINYIAGELFSEVMMYSLYIPGTDMEKADSLMTRVLNMQDEYLSRAQRPDGKDNKALVREYYRKLRVDLQTEIEAVAGEIANLKQ